VVVTSSVLWRCWLGGRKGIRPVKKLSGGVLAWLSVWCEVQTCIQPTWCHCHSLSLASVKSRLVLPFWYRLTRVVLEKGPLNGCVCVLLPVHWHGRVASWSTGENQQQSPPVLWWVSYSRHFFSQWTRQVLRLQGALNFSSSCFFVAIVIILMTIFVQWHC